MNNNNILLETEDKSLKNILFYKSILLTVKLGPVPDTLQQLLLPALGLHLLLVIPLQPGLDTPAITDSVITTIFIISVICTDLYCW